MLSSLNIAQQDCIPVPSLSQHFFKVKLIGSSFIRIGIQNFSRAANRLYIFGIHSSWYGSPDHTVPDIHCTYSSVLLVQQHDLVLAFPSLVLQPPCDSVASHCISVISFCLGQSELSSVSCNQRSLHLYLIYRFEEMAKEKLISLLVLASRYTRIWAHYQNTTHALHC